MIADGDFVIERLTGLAVVERRLAADRQDRPSRSSALISSMVAPSNTGVAIVHVHRLRRPTQMRFENLADVHT